VNEVEDEGGGCGEDYVAVVRWVGVSLQPFLQWRVRSSCAGSGQLILSHGDIEVDLPIFIRDSKYEGHTGG
jgi:hypothetical protein